MILNKQTDAARVQSIRDGIGLKKIQFDLIENWNSHSEFEKIL